jgi:UDP-N-acetyl-2-amino-2-deoxyglucuronate dehydrogenase
MKKLRAAVIGLDHVHTKEMIEAFTKNPDTELVGIAEYHECTAQELQFHLRRHTPEGIEPEVYSDYKELLKQKLDIAVVCTGVNDHADIVEETLGLGINTIIEKPMALRMDEAKRMYRAYKASTAQLMIKRRA